MTDPVTLLGALFFTVIIGSLIGLAVWLYMLPTWYAYKKNHKYKMPILIINLFFGFTTIGWVACMIWAVLQDYHQTK